MSNSVFDNLKMKSNETFILFCYVIKQIHFAKTILSKKLFSQLLIRPNNFPGKVECILLSGKDERVTKADAAVICEFHEGWLVDMDEGRGEDS